MPATSEVQQTGATDLGALLDAGKGAVVTLVAGETLLAAHRRVLATRSPVFADMLQCGSPESSSSSCSSEVTVTGVEGPVLRQLLAYCYTLQPPQLPDMAAQLLAAADKFSLSGLKDACERQLVGQLAVENAAAAAVLALSHSCPALQQAAVAFIRAHLHQVMVTQGWADAMVSHPHSVVELTRLVAEPPAEAGTPATPAEAGPTPATDQQARSGHGSPTAAAAAAAAPAAGHHTPPPDDEAVSRYRSLSIEERDKRLLQAAEKGEVGELQALLSAGADIAARDEEGNTALHWAAIRGHVEAAKCLLEARADVGARCSQQYTPLHCAAMHGRSAVARLLLAAAADPNARAHGGWAPLHIAAWTGGAHVTAALLELGADDQARNNKGQTPLDIATETGHKRIVAMLTQR